MIRLSISQLRGTRNIQTTKRFVSNSHQKLIRNHNDLKFLPKEEVTAFMAYFPKIVEDATHNDVILDYQPVNQRLERFLEYYGPNGKLLRQHLFIYSYKMIEQHFGTFDPKNMEQVYKLAWCLEMRSSQFMIVDDIIDNHEVRRGRKTWHKQDNIGLSAIMDSYLVQTSLFHLLKKYFSRHPNYILIVENFLKSDLSLSMLLESETRDFNDFTLQRYKELTKTKAIYYALGQPLHLATLLANKGSYMIDTLQKVFENIGYLLTIQNDILDCYGEDFGAKPGNDIQEKKCTALIVLALEKASPQQRKLLEESYGMKDDMKVKRVKEIYEELDIIGEYYKLEKVLHDKISEEIKNIPDDFTRSFMQKLAHVYTFGEIGTPPHTRI